MAIFTGIECTSYTTYNDIWLHLYHKLPMHLLYLCISSKYVQLIQKFKCFKLLSRLCISHCMFCLIIGVATSIWDFKRTYIDFLSRGELNW